MKTIAPSPSSVSLVKHLCRSREELMDALIEALRARYAASCVSHLAQGGTAFALYDGSKLRIWSDTVIFSDADGDQSCWIAKEWAARPEEVLCEIFVCVERAGGGLG